MIKKSNHKFFIIITSIVLFSFILSLSSCSTTEIYTIKEPQTIEQDGTIKIKSLVTIDGTMYNFNEDEAVYKKKYKANNEVIVFNSKAEITDTNTHKISRKKYLLFLNDLSSVKYSRKHMTATDALLTVGLVSVSAALLLYVLLIIAVRQDGLSFRM